MGNFNNMDGPVTDYRKGRPMGGVPVTTTDHGPDAAIVPTRPEQDPARNIVNTRHDGRDEEQK